MPDGASGWLPAAKISLMFVGFAVWGADEVWLKMSMRSCIPPLLGLLDYDTELLLPKNTSAVCYWGLFDGAELKSLKSKAAA